RGGGGGRRQADGVDEAGRGVLQVLDQLFRASDVATTAGEGVAQAAHPDVDVVGVEVLPFLHAKAAGADDADRVRFIDHQVGLVAVLHLDELRHVGIITVHA